MKQDLGDAWERSTGRFVLEQYQLHRLQETIEYAKANSVYYRKALAGLSAADLASLEDIGKFPLISSDILQRCGQQMICVGQDEIARTITMKSSGTTGNAKQLYFTMQDVERIVDFFYHGLQWMMPAGGMAVILLPSQQPDSTGNLLALALERLGGTSLGFGLVDSPLKAVREIFSMEVQTIVGFPVQVLALARAAAAVGIRPRGLQSVLLCSDYIPQVVCKELERLWQCSVIKHYGAVESGLGSAVDCQHNQGYHIRESDLLIEIIDPESGEPLKASRVGEIVLTTLQRQGMPLIRYRTGDYGRLLQEPCPCGSNLFRLDRLQGRIAYRYLLDNSHHLTQAYLDECLLQVPGLLDFKVTLSRLQGHDFLKVALVCLPDRGKDVAREVKAVLTGLPLMQGVLFSVSVVPHHRIQPSKRTLQSFRKENEKVYSTTL